MLDSRLFCAAALGAILSFATAQAATPTNQTRAAAIRAKIDDPAGGLIVIAHRGCHNPAPRHGLGAAPENSLAALEHCAVIGADVMELDVRRSKDGHLVIVHDETVDRTTNGQGRVADLTLTQLKALRLRQNEGGADAPMTDDQIPTLGEVFASLKGRLLLNLDVKDAIYGEVADAVKRYGAADLVMVKAVAGTGSPALADVAPYDAAPFMPILSSGAADFSDLAKVVERQAAGRRTPAGYEVPKMPASALRPLVAAVAAAKGRVWANTIFGGWILGFGNDIDALRDPDSVWGRLNKAGVTMIQTDEPEALRLYADRPPN